MWKRSTHGCADGFSLVELMVAITLVLGITGAALSLGLSSRGLYETDEARTRLDQELRAGIELVGTDLRQAGERLPEDFPAIEIVDGAAGAPDLLVLRRNLIDDVLPLCADLASGDAAVRIATTVAPPPGCNALPDDDGDGWPDNLGRWRARRLGAGGTQRAYVWDPVARRGEFFVHEDEALGEPRLLREASAPLSASYAVADQCRVYLLEERRWTLDGDTLRLLLDDGATVLDAVPYLTDFQSEAVLTDGTRLAAFGAADVWSDLRGIEIRLDGRTAARRRDVERSLSVELFPRNVLSR